MSDNSSKKASHRSVSPVPAHANAQAHAKVMTWLRSAPQAEVRKLSVKAGVYSQSGDLTKPYKSGRTG